MFSYIRNLYGQLKKIYYLRKQFIKIHDLFNHQPTSDNDVVGAVIHDLEVFKNMVFNCGSLYVKFLQWYISKLKANVSSNVYCDNISNGNDETRDQDRDQERDQERDRDREFQIKFINYFQDIFENCPFHSREHTEQIFRDSMPGYELETYIDISTFREIASGSIGQVYYGRRLSDGKELAIKVKHPDIAHDLENQLELIRFIRYVQSFKFIRKRYNMVFPIDDFITDINLQCDFNNEANNCKRFRENFKDSSERIIFPDIIYQSEDLLISEYIAGQDFNTLTPIQKRDTTLNFVCFFYQMLFVDNFIHGDLHCKNWKIRVITNNEGIAIPQIIVYDFGICFSNISSQITRDFWFAIGKYDLPNIYKIIKQYLLCNNYQELDDTIIENEIQKLFKSIMKDSLGIGLVMKSLINFFNAHNIMVNKFFMNFSILMCLIEEFLRENSVINREQNIQSSNGSNDGNSGNASSSSGNTGSNYGSNMFEIINDNDLDIIAYCQVKKCYPVVLKTITDEMSGKYDTYKTNKSNMSQSITNDTNTEPSLFHSIKLSGLVFKPPGSYDG